MTQSTTMFSWPRESIFENQCVRDIGRYAAREQVKYATILTDQGVVAEELVEPIRASLAEAGIMCDVVDQISPEVPHIVIAGSAGRCKQAGTQPRVAVGGGSVIDTAKAIGILLTNAGSIQDHEGVDKSAISTLSEQALHDPFLRTNPRPLNWEDIEAIYEEAFVEYVESDSGAPRRARTTVHWTLNGPASAPAGADAGSP